MRRRSVYFAYEASPPQPGAPRGVRARGSGIRSVAGGRDAARGASRVPRSRVPADGADRRARAERGARRRHSQSSHQALARQPVSRARTVQESGGPGVLRRAVLARRVRGPGQGRQAAGRGRRPADEEPVPRVPRQHDRSRHRDDPQRGALLRGLRRLAAGRAERRDRSRLVVGARRRRRGDLPQGYRRHVGGPPASRAPHPGQPLLLRFSGGGPPPRAGIVADCRCSPKDAHSPGGGIMNRAFVVLFSILGLVSCASGPSRERDLVNRAADGFGGDTWASVKTVAIQGTVKQWEPEQSEVPGGEMRFANEASFETALDRASRVGRTDLEKKFAYPAPRTYKFSEILTPDAGYVIGIDTTARNAQNLQMNPPAHAMSSLRLATAQREQRRGAINRPVLAMGRNPDPVQAAPRIVV